MVFHSCWPSQTTERVKRRDSAGEQLVGSIVVAPPIFYSFGQPNGPMGALFVVPMCLPTHGGWASFPTSHFWDGQPLHPTPKWCAAAVWNLSRSPTLTADEPCRKNPQLSLRQVFSPLSEKRSISIWNQLFKKKVNFFQKAKVNSRWWTCQLCSLHLAYWWLTTTTNNSNTTIISNSNNKLLPWAWCSNKCRPEMARVPVEALASPVSSPITSSDPWTPSWSGRVFNVAKSPRTIQKCTTRRFPNDSVSSQ